MPLTGNKKKEQAWLGCSGCRGSLLPHEKCCPRSHGESEAEAERGAVWVVQPEGAPDAYLCPPSMDRRSAVEGVLMLALSFRSIVKHSSLTASCLTLDRVRQFGYVAERHGSLGNWLPDRLLPLPRAGSR